MKLDLPFPDWDLSPNARRDRRGLTGKRKAFAHSWGWIAKTDRPQNLDRAKIPIALLFYPPNGNNRDRDNCLSACKSGLDAIAKVWGIDDSQFAPILIDIIEPDPPLGKVELYIDNVDMVLQSILKGQENEK